MGLGDYPDEAKFCPQCGIKIGSFGCPFCEADDAPEANLRLVVEEDEDEESA